MADSFTYSLSTMWAQALTPGRRRSLHRRQIAPLPRAGEGMGVREEICANLCPSVAEIGS